MSTLLPHDKIYTPDEPAMCDAYKTIDQEIVKVAHRIIFWWDEMYLTNGLAAQYHIPPAFRRGSLDMDVTSLTPYSWTEFNEEMAFRLRTESIGLIIEKVGVQIPYRVFLLRKEQSFVVHICNWGHESMQRNHFDIALARFSLASAQRRREQHEREIEHCLWYGQSNVGVKVLNPVDIMYRKANRLNEMLHGENISIPSKEEMRLDNIWVLRDRLTQTARKYFSTKDPANHAESHTLRMQLRALCDAYDIHHLDVYAHVSQSYMEEVLKDAEKHGKNRRELEAILAKVIR